MKKSKVLIPAMALLLFSTAASITGTVAWFTASRVFTTEIGNFQVGNVDGDLDVKMLPGIGTKGVDEDGNDVTSNDDIVAIKPKANAHFTHGSVNHTTTTGEGTSAIHDPTAWTLNKDATSDSNKYVSRGPLSTATENTSSTTGWVGTVSGSINYYIAMSWTMTFKYEFREEVNNVSIYFDSQNSTITLPTGFSDTTSATEKTINGFRVAFITEETQKVWGKRDATFAGTADSTTHQYPDLKYVNSAGSVAHYTESDYIPYGYTPAAAPTDTTTRAAAGDRLDHLFFIDKPTGANALTYASVTVKCVVWFEGEDPHVISKAEMDQVTVKMSFYARSVTSGS